MSDGDTGAGFAMGLIIGAAVGVAIGFLYAPRAGAETREMLKERAEKARERATEAAEHTKETAADVRQKEQARLGRKKTDESTA